MRGCTSPRTSLEHLVEAGRDKDVWMANFVLRMFDYEPVEEMLAERGYVTERLGGALFPQRRFVSADEQAHVLDNLRRRGISAGGGGARGLVSGRTSRLASGEPDINSAGDDLLALRIAKSAVPRRQGGDRAWLGHATQVLRQIDPTSETVCPCRQACAGG